MKSVFCFAFLSVFFLSLNSYAVKNTTAVAENKSTVLSNNANKKEQKTTPAKKSFGIKAIQKKGSDVSLFVLILLAIFVPPLCVYLYDGKKKFPLFWITLVCCILAVVFKLLALLAGILAVGILLYVFWALAIILAIANLFDIFV